MPISLRTAREDDVPTIEAIAVAAGMFTAEEVGFLGERFREAVPGACHWWVAMDDEGDALVGAVYVAPEPFADRMWNVYFVAVAPSAQGRGVGAQLMQHVEATLRAMGPDAARTVVVETSSTTTYEGTRAFYRRLGYDEEARIRQFYGPEDDKIVFWKSLR